MAVSRLLVGVGLVATLAGVSACGAGLESGTSLETARVPGNGTNHGSLGLRDFYLVTPKTGATSTWLTGAIVNQGKSGDTLSSVSVSGASAVDILSPGQSVPLLAVGPSASTSTSPSTQPTPVLPAGGTVQLPPSALVSFFPPNTGPQTPSLQVTGLQAPLSTGDTVRVTFDFTNAGVVSLQVPVAPLPRTSD